jgi:hypothetical protein
MQADYALKLQRCQDVYDQYVQSGTQNTDGKIRQASASPVSPFAHPLITSLHGPNFTERRPVDLDNLMNHLTAQGLDPSFVQALDTLVEVPENPLRDNVPYIPCTLETFAQLVQAVNTHHNVDFGHMLRVLEPLCEIRVVQHGAEYSMRTLMPTVGQLLINIMIRSFLDPDRSVSANIVDILQNRPVHGVLQFHYGMTSLEALAWMHAVTQMRASHMLLYEYKMD